MRIIQIGHRFLSISTIGRTKIPVSKTSLYVVPNTEYMLFNDCKQIIVLTHFRSFHGSSTFFDEQSKVEKTVKLLKKEASSDEKGKPIGAVSSVPAVQSATTLTTTASTDVSLVKRKSIWERIVHELKHYYNGFKLLFIETKIAYRLLRQVLNGHTLTRRERKQFIRTASDVFRLVPFSVFIIVPFMEFTLPIFLKLFPNMLPSTFQEADKEKEKLKKQLKAKLEVAKFLQDTLEQTALKSKRKQSDDALPAQFVEFMKKVRSTGVQPSTEEIMKFSSLFENKSTLDHLDRPQLVALCKILGISSIGPDYYLRFTLHVKLRKLEADDKLIESEGIEILTVEELQAACRDRGMRFYGVSVERLRSQLQQWLDLHLNKRIPSTILLLSRSLYLPENVSQEVVLKAAIQALPKAIDNVTAVKLAQVSGERVDNTQRIEYVKREDEVIRKEKEDKAKTKISTEEEMKKKKITEQITSQPVEIPADIPKAEILVDKAPLITDQTKQEKKEEQNIDVGQFEAALGRLVKQKAKEVHSAVEAIQGLKHDVKEYKDDIKELETITATKQLKHLSETRSAKALSKRIDKLVGDLDRIVETLGKKQDILKQDIQTEENTLKDQTSLKSEQIQQHKDFLNEKRNLLVSTQEFVNTIRQIQQASNDANEAQILDIIHQFDHNKDGFIEADEILKALELVGNENVQISKKHLKEILDLVRKEHFIQVKEKFEAKAKQQSILSTVSNLDKSQIQTKTI